MNGRLFGRADDCTGVPSGNDDLDRIFDPVARVSQGGRQIGERECVRVNLRRIEALFRHQCHRTAGGTAAFATDAKGADVVFNEMGKIDRGWFMRESGETYLASAIGHVESLIKR